MLKRQAAWVLALWAALVPDPARAQPPIPHEARTVEGWTVQVDQSLLSGPHQALGDAALRLLGDKLYELTLQLPRRRIDQLRTIPIWLDREHELKSMQYHPSPAWLSEHNYDPAMARGVHIAKAQRWIDHVARHDQPAALLHELAHAYHDQFLGWEHAGIRAAYQDFVQCGRFDTVLDIQGRQRRHYGLTNEKEFFAEMTECFVSTNDFYPFVRGELRETAPAVYALMQAIWLADQGQADERSKNGE